MKILFVITSILLFCPFLVGSSLLHTDENIFLSSIGSAIQRSQDDFFHLNMNHNEWSDDGYTPQVNNFVLLSHPKHFAVIQSWSGSL